MGIHSSAQGKGMANWEGVSEFVAVAERESFTGAAQKLATSVAQISRRVANLEERLAVKLLNRTTRKVSLTEAWQLIISSVSCWSRA